MIHLFDTCWASYEADGSIRPLSEAAKADGRMPLPRYWVGEADVTRAWGSRRPARSYFAWRGIARTTDARTAIGTVMPAPVPGGGNFDIVVGLTPVALPMFAALFSSYAFDFVVRQMLSNMHLQFTVVRQLPMPSPSQLEDSSLPVGGVAEWIAPRVDRLNSWIVDERERARVRAELDAAAFHLYGLDREEVSYVMDTFPIVKRKDEGLFGSYRTKELILEVYDAIQAAIDSGGRYRSPFDHELALTTQRRSTP